MLNVKLFERANIIHANDYVMAKEERLADDVIQYMNDSTIRVDNIIFKSKTNQIRFMLLPCYKNGHTTEVFNVTDPAMSFLQQFWDLGIPALKTVITQYMSQSNFQKDYKDLDDASRAWILVTSLNNNSALN